MRKTGHIRVLAMPAFRNQHSNPYNSLLYSALARHDVKVSEFSFFRAAGLRYEILHIHWPELYLNSHYFLKAMLFSAILLLLLCWAKLAGKSVVWTVHNLEPHHVKYPKLHGLFWRVYPKLVDATLSLSHANQRLISSRYPELASKPCFVTYHGLYDNFYPRNISRAQARSDLGVADDKKVCVFVGQVKGYKRIDRLVDLFRTAPALSSVELVVAGRFDDEALLDDIAIRAGNRANIRIHSRFIPDEELQVYLHAADMCILPFEQIFNSGSALLAISFGCRVLVPHTENFDEYAKLTGGMLRVYEGELASNHILQVLEEPNSETRRADSLCWDKIAAATANAFRCVHSPGNVK